MSAIAWHHAIVAHADLVSLVEFRDRCSLQLRSVRDPSRVADLVALTLDRVIVVRHAGQLIAGGLVADKMTVDATIMRVVDMITMPLDIAAVLALRREVYQHLLAHHRRTAFRACTATVGVAQAWLRIRTREAGYDLAAIVAELEAEAVGR